MMTVTLRLLNLFGVSTNYTKYCHCMCFFVRTYYVFILKYDIKILCDAADKFIDNLFTYRGPIFYYTLSAHELKNNFLNT